MLRVCVYELDNARQWQLDCSCLYRQSWNQILDPTYGSIKRFSAMTMDNEMINEHFSQQGEGEGNTYVCNMKEDQKEGIENNTHVSLVPLFSSYATLLLWQWIASVPHRHGKETVIYKTNRTQSTRHFAFLLFLYYTQPPPPKEGAPSQFNTLWRRRISFSGVAGPTLRDFSP